MPRQRQLSIAEKFHRTDGRAFELSTSSGWAETTYRPELGRYLITNIQSLRPRKGVGKFLLRASLEHAQELQAEYISALIISRECIDIMSSVFGQEYLEIERLGKYRRDIVSDEDVASAKLYYPLDPKID